MRSFKKYVAERVLTEYEVRLSSEEGAWERPFCRVAWTTPVALIAHGARVLECRRTMQVVCWPVQSETPDEARLVGEGLTEELTRAFAIGLHPTSYSGSRAHPFRVPIYDYQGKGALDVTLETDRAANDFAWLPEQPNVGDIDDPNTDLSRLVIADFRVKWMRSTAVPESLVPVVTVGAGAASSGP